MAVLSSALKYIQSESGLQLIKLIVAVSSRSGSVLSDSVNQIFIVNSCDSSVNVASGSARNRLKLDPDYVKRLENGESTSID